MSRYRARLAEYDPPTLRLLRLALLLTAASCAWPAAALAHELDPGPLSPSARVGVFYYPWFATPQSDGRYAHWQQGGPAAAGRRRVELLPGAGHLLVGRRARRRRADARDRGGGHRRRDHVVVGAGLARGPAAAAAAGRRAAHGLAVAAHLEPYRGRTVASTEADIAYLRGLGISDFYVWASLGAARRRVGGDEPARRGRARLREHQPRRPRGRGRLRRALHLRRAPLRRRALPAALHAGAAPRPPLRPVRRPRLRRPARDRRPARQAAARRRPLRRDVARRAARAGGPRHDHELQRVARGHADRAGAQRPGGYESYEGAWGLHGRAAETAYLDRTAFWVQRLMRR